MKPDLVKKDEDFQKMKPAYEREKLRNDIIIAERRLLKADSMKFN